MLETFQDRSRTRAHPGPPNLCEQTMKQLAHHIRGPSPWIETLLNADDPRRQILAMTLLRQNPAEGRAFAAQVATTVKTGVDAMVAKCVARNQALQQRKNTKRKIRTPTECRRLLEGGPAPHVVRHGCVALEHIGSASEAHRLLTIGINGYFARSCVRFFLQGDLTSDAVRRFIEYEHGLRPNGGLVRTLLGMAGPRAVASGIRSLEVNQGRPNPDGDLRCFLGTIIADLRDADTLGATGRALSPVLRKRLLALTKASSEWVRDCAKGALKNLGGPPKALIPFADTPTRSTMHSFGPFCTR